MKKVLLGSVLATTLFASNGAVFAQRTDTEQTQKQEEVSLNTELQLPENGGFNGKVPNSKSEKRTIGGEQRDKLTDRQKAWGFNYVPKGMSTSEEVALKEREAQDFNLNVHGEESTYSGDESIHIGVKNKTRLKSEWRLQAKLESNFHNPEQLPLSLVNNPLTGATFKLQNTQAKENKTSESALEKTDVSLVDFSEGELKTFVSGEKEINTDATSILEGKQDIVHNAIYDYAFNGAKFNVPNTRRMPVGEYKTQITWSLEQVPTGGSDNEEK